MKLLLLALLLICQPAMAQSAPPEIVLQTIAMESANQSLEGQAWVAKTIQTRTLGGKRSLESVVNRPKAYSCWNSQKQAKTWLDKHYSLKVRQRALQAYRMAFSLPPVTHYHTKAIKPYWAKSKMMHKVATVEDHIFYNESEIFA